MTEQEKREKVIANVTAIVSDMQEEVDEWKDYSDSELSDGLTCDCDWWYKTLQSLRDAISLLKAQEAVKPSKRPVHVGGINTWYWVCGKCGCTIIPGGKFCQSCGQEVKWE